VTRQSASSGSPLEPQIGFSRAVRIGPWIAVAGTAPIGVTTDDVYAQTVRCFDIAETALRDVGASLSDVIRTRIMLTDISRWDDAARAHGDRLRSVRPACTFVQVTGFIDPAWLVEIELDAVIDQNWR
jgi:enamine deaminase RidA (YjgF/YER057c/UK114 family)